MIKTMAKEGKKLSPYHQGAEIQTDGILIFLCKQLWQTLSHKRFCLFGIRQIGLFINKQAE